VAQIMNPHLLGHASTEAGVLVIERLGGRIDVDVGGHRPEHLIDGSEVCVGRGQAGSGSRDQTGGDLRRGRRWLPGESRIRSLRPAFSL